MCILLGFINSIQIAYYIISSSFTAREDRYNHLISDNENDDDDDDFDDTDIDFGNFSTCSPRFSRLISTHEPPNTTHLKQLKEQASKEVDDEDISDGGGIGRGGGTEDTKGEDGNEISKSRNRSKSSTSKNIKNVENGNTASNEIEGKDIVINKENSDNESVNNNNEHTTDNDNAGIDFNTNADDDNSSTHSSAPSSPLATSINTTSCDSVRKKLDSVLLLNSQDTTGTDSGNDSGTQSSGQSSLNASLNSGNSSGGLLVNTTSGLRPSLLKQIHVDVRRQHRTVDDTDRDTE